MLERVINMQKMILIGGGETGRGNKPYETKEFDQEAVRLTGKERPTFLFIGLASSFSDSYYDTMKKVYQDLGCETIYLKKKNIKNNPDIVKNKIAKADIIYFCGGDSLKLINDIKEYHLDSLLKEALDRGCVMVGMSAGAILLSKEGFSDSLILEGKSDRYSFVEGLNFLPISFCPHYVKGSQKDIELHEEIGNRYVLACDDQTGIEIVGDKVRIIKSNKEKKVNICYVKEKFLVDEIKESDWFSLNKIIK